MAQENFTIYHKPFSALTPHELYAIIRLRNEVFVVEQNCVFQDADNKDLHCHHLMVWDNKALVAYARLLPPGLAYEQMSIGRIISSPSYRGTGVGKVLVNESIMGCEKLFGKGAIKIGAQLYLQKFYESFGFKQISDIYFEDDIKHILMLKE
jgi:ElaA protein